jgi:large subunit ribosomal protein L11
LKCAGVANGSGKAGHEVIGKVHVKQVYEIAKLKKTDQHLAHINLDAIARSVVGSAKSMGIEIVK